MNMEHLCRALGCGPDDLLTPDGWWITDYSTQTTLPRWKYRGPATLDDQRALLLAGPMLAKLDETVEVGRHYKNGFLVSRLRYHIYDDIGEPLRITHHGNTLPAALYAALVAAGVLEEKP